MRYKLRGPCFWLGTLWLFCVAGASDWNAIAPGHIVPLCTVGLLLMTWGVGAYQNPPVRKHPQHGKEATPMQYRKLTAAEQLEALIARQQFESTWYIAGNPYGYRLDISHKDIRPLYDQFRQMRKVPHGSPLSDDERHEFERWALEVLKKEKHPSAATEECSKTHL